MFTVNAILLIDYSFLLAVLWHLSC